MALRRVSPAEAKELMEREGYTYLDVRSVPEFEKGHPTGAYNVPLLHMGPAGMSPNADFLPVIERNFPKDAKLVVGCKMGGRSLQAATVLLSAGYVHVVDQRAGYEGPPGEPGWRPQGLPTAAEAPPDRTYEALLTKAR